MKGIVAGDLGGTNWTLALIQKDKVVAKLTVQPKSKTTKDVVALVNSFLLTHLLKKNEVGFAFGIGGPKIGNVFIDKSKKLRIDATLLKKAFGKNTVIMNDAEALGAGLPVVYKQFIGKRAAVIIVGTGLGGATGIVGEPFLPGEPGHFSMHNPLTNKQGTFGDLLSGQGLVMLEKKFIGKKIPPENLFKHKDKRVTTIKHIFSETLGWFVQHMILGIKAEVIFLWGGVIRSNKDLLGQKFKSTLYKHAEKEFASLLRKTKIIVIAKDELPLLGIARMAQKQK